VSEPNYSRRLKETRKRIAAEGLDALLVTSQYNRRYLTGFSAHDGDFTENSGWVLVTPKSLGLINRTFNLTGLEHELDASGTTWLKADGKQWPDVLAEQARAEGIKKLGFEKAWIAYDRYAEVKGALGAGIELTPVDDLIVFVRAEKDPFEIKTLRRAAKVGDRAFRRLLKRIKVGMTEREIAAKLEAYMVDAGAEGPSFPTIVACGPCGATPHWEPTEREARPGEPILIDFGVKVDGYCSDSTRTICLGKPDAQLVEIYHVVRKAQDAAVAALERGVRRGREVHAAAAEVIEKAGYGDRFFHGLGHGVGYAVHELPAMGQLRFKTPEAEAALARAEPISDGMVVTNEPGIYIPGWGGVRLEDMILVGKKGVEVISERNPEQIIALPA
jgi:Xaa-Pro aminopeptidase